MAVGFDAASEYPTTQSAGVSLTITLSWNHIPVTSTPRGVGVFLSYAPTSLSQAIQVKYGGVALTRRAFARDTTTEPGVMEFHYLGSGVPTGNQAFTVLLINNASGAWATGFTVSASFSTTVVQTILVENDTSLNEKTLSTIGVGTRFAGAYYGGAAPPGVGANSTTLFDIDYGAFAARVVRETTAGSGNRVVGFAAGTADDVAAIYVAIEEEAQVIPAQTLSAVGLASGFATGLEVLSSRRRLSASGVVSGFNAGLATIQASPVFISATGVASGFTTGLAVLSQLETATYTLSATIPAGWKYTTIGTPNTASQYSVAYSSSPVLATSDLVIFEKWARSGGVTVSSSVTISTDGIVTFSPRSASASLSFQYFFWDDSVSAYGSTVTWQSPPIKSLVPTGLSSDFTVGTANLVSQNFISATGLATSAAFGTSTLYSKAYLSATGLATSQAFGAHTLLAGQNTLSATGVSSNFAVGGHSVYGISYLSATGLATSETFGIHTVLAGSAFLSASGVSSNFAVGAHTVSTGALSTGTYSLSVTVPAGWKYTVLSNPDISSTANIAYGQSATVATGDIVLFQEYARKDNATTSYSITISTDGSIVVFAQSDSASLSFQYFFWDDSASVYGSTGTFSILEWQTLVPTGLASSATYGQHVVTPKSTTLFATGLSSSFSTGLTSVIISGVSIQTTGLATQEAFGTHTLVAGDVILIPSGYYSPELFGTHLLTASGVVIQPSGLESSLSIGTAVLTSFAGILPSGLDSGLAFGQHLLVYTQYISPSGKSYFAIGVARINEQGEVVPLPVHDIFEWLYESGATGGVMKRTKEYLKLQGFTGNTNTALFNWLRSLGYTKSLTSMLDKFERDNTIQHGPE